MLQVGIGEVVDVRRCAIYGDGAEVEVVCGV